MTGVVTTCAGAVTDTAVDAAVEAVFPEAVAVLAAVEAVLFAAAVAAVETWAAAVVMAAAC